MTGLSFENEEHDAEVKHNYGAKHGHGAKQAYPVKHEQCVHEGITMELSGIGVPRSELARRSLNKTSEYLIKMIEELEQELHDKNVEIQNLTELHKPYDNEINISVDYEVQSSYTPEVRTKYSGAPKACIERKFIDSGIYQHRECNLCGAGIIAGRVCPYIDKQKNDTTIKAGPYRWKQ